MNLMSVPGFFVCIRFLISMCMLIVSIALLISSATVIVRAGRNLVYVLPSLYSIVFCTRVAVFSSVCNY